MRYVVKTPPPVKDETGAYVKVSPEPLPSLVDVSIDDLLGKGLLAVERVMKSILTEASSGNPSREAVMNLKDCMAILWELKKKERDFLDNLTDEELERMTKK